MKIRYEFMTGEVAEIEVPEDIREVSVELDRDIFNSDRRETRRHNSIEKIQEQGIQIADERIDIVSMIEKQERNETLKKALEKLLPQQRVLIQKVFFEGQSIAQVARDEGVDKSAISRRLNRIYQQLNKLLVS